MPPDVTIRLLTVRDAALLEHAHGDVLDEPVRADRSAAYLGEPGHMLMVALRGDLVIAQVAAVIHRHPDKATELYIDEVAVAGPWRRQGLASEMLQQMFAHGRTLGCEEAWVGTEPDNVPARQLYESLRSSSDEEGDSFVMYVYDLRQPAGVASSV